MLDKVWLNLFFFLLLKRLFVKRFTKIKTSLTLINANIPPRLFNGVTFTTLQSCIGSSCHLSLSMKYFLIF